MSSPVSHDECDEWSEIYDETLLTEGVPDEFKFVETPTRTVATTYYQTYGGGPEGGYFVRWELNAFRASRRVFAVHRGWLEPWSITELQGRFEKTTRNGVPVCHVVPFA